MIINDFYTQEVEVYRDPELAISINKETGEEKLKLAESKDEEQIKVHILIDPHGYLVKPACLYLKPKRKNWVMFVNVRLALIWRDLKRKN